MQGGHSFGGLPRALWDIWQSWTLSVKNPEHPAPEALCHRSTCAPAKVSMSSTALHSWLILIEVQLLVLGRALPGTRGIMGAGVLEQNSSL